MSPPVAFEVGDALVEPEAMLLALGAAATKAGAKLLAVDRKDERLVLVFDREVSQAEVANALALIRGVKA